MQLHWVNEPLIDGDFSLSGLVFTRCRVAGAAIDDVSMLGLNLHDVGISGAHLNSDLSELTLNNCQLAGMRVDGVLVADMLDAYRKAH